MIRRAPMVLALLAGCVGEGPPRPPAELPEPIDTPRDAHPGPEARPEAGPTPQVTRVPVDAAPQAPDNAPAVQRPEGWTPESHGKAPPRYDLALPQGKVARIDLQIAAADWQAMLADMTALGGRFGGGGLPLPPTPGSPNLFARDPIYAPATVAFGGKRWPKVGVRFRGNATLALAWRGGKLKLPLRLDFDELEDRFPEVKDQRFHGLRALSLLNNWGDPSLVREKVAGDVYRLAGVPSGRAAFYRVFIDHGQGPLYFGLYTAVETPDEPMLQAQLGASGGNLYKPEGEGAKFVTFDRASFEKKSNEKAADFSDVQAVFAALHASRSDPAAWRARLDKVWNGDGFMRWLAVNTVMQNWDTYGVIAHNFYLYGHPNEGGRLHWIPWDHNESFKPGGSLPWWKGLSLTMVEVNAGWPLIRYLFDDPVYRVAYVRHMRAFVTAVWTPQPIAARLRAEHALVAPYVVGPEGEKPGYTLLATPAEFNAEIGELVKHAQSRYDAATGLLKLLPQ